MTNPVAFVAALALVSFTLHGCGGGGGGAPACSSSFDMSSTFGACMQFSLDNVDDDCCKVVTGEIPNPLAPVIPKPPNMDDVCSKCKGQGSEKMKEQLNKMCSNASTPLTPLSVSITGDKTAVSMSIEGAFKLDASKTCKSESTDCKLDMTEDSETVSLIFKTTSSSCCGALQTVSKLAKSVLDTSTTPPPSTLQTDVKAICDKCSAETNLAISAAIKELQAKEMCTASGAVIKALKDSTFSV